MRCNADSGLTLIELLVVVIVVGVLATLATQRYFKTVECRYQREAREMLHELLKADQVYRLEHGAFTNDVTRLPAPDPNNPPGRPVTYDIAEATTETLFVGVATHVRGYTTTLRYDAPTRSDDFCEAGWPCPTECYASVPSSL